MADIGRGPDGNAISTNGKFDIVNASSGATPVAAGGTITFQYLPARALACYAARAVEGTEAAMTVRALQGMYVQDQDFTINFGAANIVVTWLGLTTIPANTNVSLQLTLRDTSGDPASVDAFGISPDIFPAGL